MSAVVVIMACAIGFPIVIVVGLAIACAIMSSARAIALHCGASEEVACAFAGLVWFAAGGAGCGALMWFGGVGA